MLKSILSMNPSKKSGSQKKEKCVVKIALLA